jgi:hypothetical protein
MRGGTAVLAIAPEIDSLSLRDFTAIDSVRLLHHRSTMVDSPKERTMTDGSSSLPERVEVIEQKLDGLIQSVDARFEQVDRRFDQVDAAIVEQRAYTEFAYDKLDSKMDGGFARLDSKMDAGVARLDSKMDAGVARLDSKMDDGLGKVEGQFTQLERKIDQIIDLHLPKSPADASNSE